MVVGPDGELPLPWLAEPLAAALASQRGHALLLHGAGGDGVLPFALVLAQAWLCEARPARQAGPADGLAGPAGPCGRCDSCRQVLSHVHPDLRVLLPETLRREHDWALPDDRTEGEEGKRKPSRQIRIDEVRGVVDWVTRTSARGRAKVALLHPAEALNAQAANALLKTLEEPPPGTRLLLTAADPALLLPTVRSRCQRLQLATPAADVAEAWLAAQGVAQPAVLLAGCSGRPLDALALARAGVDAAAWAGVPGAVRRGAAAAFAGWPLPQLVDALGKLCHDAMARAGGGTARFFPQAEVPADAALPALVAWQQDLARLARHDEHPWNEGLLLDAVLARGARALRRASGAGKGHAAATAPTAIVSPGGRRFDTLAP